MNKIIITGNVVHTPEMRTTPGGKNCCNFSVAVRRKFRNQETKEYETDFFDVVAWDNLANVCSLYIEKGKKVLVSGEMRSRDYTDKNGVKKRAWTINAADVEFLSYSQQQENKEGFTQIDDDTPLPF
nr:MAG TPA: Single strand binding protein [Caudoviricetes sp.]